MGMACAHARGDFIDGYWLCADCWSRMDGRPRKYKTNDTLQRGTVSATPPQIIAWEAEIAIASGVRLSAFVTAMAKAYIRKTRGRMLMTDAKNAAIAYLSSFLDPYGHHDYDWSIASAADFARDDMEDWEREGGNQ